MRVFVVSSVYFAFFFLVESIGEASSPLTRASLKLPCYSQSHEIGFVVPGEYIRPGQDVQFAVHFQSTKVSTI